jgi:hypothetical protein
LGFAGSAQPTTLAIGSKPPLAVAPTEEIPSSLITEIDPPSARSRKAAKW